MGHQWRGRWELRSLAQTSTRPLTKFLDESRDGVVGRGAGGGFPLSLVASGDSRAGCGFHFGV